MAGVMGPPDKLKALVCGLLAFLAATCANADKGDEFLVVNDSGRIVDVILLPLGEDLPEFMDELIAHYSELEVGDIDSRETCHVCDMEPNAEIRFAWEFENPGDALIVGKTDLRAEIIYKQIVSIDTMSSDFSVVVSSQ